MECRYLNGRDLVSYVYKIENKINNKKYIGKTLYSIERRWGQHVENYNRGIRRQLPLYSAMEKYGIDNFEISCIEKVDNPDDLSEREKYWIDYYDTYNNGYNATRGGDGSLLYDYNAIWDLWEKGKNIKQISKEIGCNDFVVRTVLDLHNVSTDERIERSRDAQMRSNAPYRRQVDKIDKKTNAVIKTYESISDAAKDIGCDSSYLSKICSKSGVFNGFIWKFNNSAYIKRDFAPKRVAQIDLQTNEIICIYDSISDAARSVNGDASYISKVCRNKQETSKGYGWEYA